MFTVEEIDHMFHIHVWTKHDAQWGTGELTDMI